MGTIPGFDGERPRSTVRTDVLTALSRLDLNLVLALDALLIEQNVTNAGRRLNLSQPALSAALSRLRAHFDDPLLVRKGRQLELSPLAHRLKPLVSSAVNRLHTVFSVTSEFDPAEENREFLIDGSDYSVAVIGPRLRGLVAEAAPNVRLRFRCDTTGWAGSPRSVLDHVDIAIMPHGYVFDVPHIDVIEDRWVCIVSADNTAVGEELTLDNLSALPWVSSFQSERPVTPALRQLEILGVQPRIDTVVDGFLTLPYYVSGTDRIAFIQERLARAIPAELGLRRLPPPFDVVPHVGAAWWHPAHDRDPAHRWLRSLLKTVARDGFGPAPTASPGA